MAADAYIDNVAKCGNMYAYGELTGTLLGAGAKGTCNTDLSARIAVAITAAVNPVSWNEGSAPVAMTMPTTTGSSAAYTTQASRLRSMMNARMAVNTGVVAPIACDHPVLALARCFGTGPPPPGTHHF